MKKYLTACVILSALILTGCGSKDTPKQMVQGTAANPTQKAIVLSGSTRSVPQVGSRKRIFTSAMMSGSRSATGNTASGAESAIGKSAQKPVKGTPAKPKIAVRKGVVIKNSTFTPQDMQIEAGTIISWSNNDKVVHTVTADNGAFKANIAPGATFSYTFSKSGSYDYHCDIHPEMKARVLVQ